MKFDLHCHTKAGSLDSNVPIEKYVQSLKSQGFAGMMISDHDSYKGCDYWDSVKHLPEHQDFTVIKGIEYDTCDAGHFLVVMPDNIKLKVLTIRGMKLRNLIDLVHEYGGILGPAHPYGVRCSSAMLFKKVMTDPNVMHQVDFIETFNTCESPVANMLAHKLALKYGKPGTGGSDAHREKYVGMGYTEIDGRVLSNSDFISAVKHRRLIHASGTERVANFKSKAKESRLSVWGFLAFNKTLSSVLAPYRNSHAFNNAYIGE